MSTRGVIARATKDVFEGRYHHWDAYPDGLGKTLYGLFSGHFKGDLEAMLKFLLDDHTAGWSTINNRDFTLEAGFDGPGPNCYCHGSRKGRASAVTNRNASGCGCEWAYVFSSPGGVPTMEIYSAYHRDGNKAIGMFGQGDPLAEWKRCASVNLLEPEPDWEAIDTAGSKPQRPMVNFVQTTTGISAWRATSRTH